MPRILVLTGAGTRTSGPYANWLPDRLHVDRSPQLRGHGPASGYDVIWNAGAYPSAANPTARARLQAFFAAGGGYLGHGVNGADFLTTGSLVTGLTAAPGPEPAAVPS